MNTVSLDTLCGALCYAMGVEAPACSAAPNESLTEYVDVALKGGKCDRLFMYNPDAIGEWIVDKYPDFVKEVEENTELQLPMCTVMPSVTPVCFGTMYTGAQPQVHGIRKYEKPVIRIDTMFDAMIRGGKKCAIVSTDGDSMSRIFNEREMDYYYYETLDEVNAKAAELIIGDKYDVICVYNGNYDATMHRWGTEAPLSLGEIRANAHTFAMFAAMIRNCWGQHDTLLGFAMDHGCHDIDAGCGSHGLDMEEDIDIRHFYRIIRKQIGE